MSDIIGVNKNATFCYKMLHFLFCYFYLLLWKSIFYFCYFLLFLSFIFHLIFPFDFYRYLSQFKNNLQFSFPFFSITQVYFQIPIHSI